MKGNLKITEKQRQLLKPLCHLIWWYKEEECLSWPERLIAQIMKIGSLDDMQMLQKNFSKEQLGYVLHHAEIGWLDELSWVYWHKMVFDMTDEQIPPMPVRKIE